MGNFRLLTSMGTASSTYKFVPSWSQKTIHVFTYKGEPFQAKLDSTYPPDGGSRIDAPPGGAVRVCVETHGRERMVL